MGFPVYCTPGAGLGLALQPHPHKNRQTPSAASAGPGRLGGRSAAGGAGQLQPCWLPTLPPPRPYIPPCPPVAHTAGLWLLQEAACPAPHGAAAAGVAFCPRLPGAAMSCPLYSPWRPEPAPGPLRGGLGVVSPCSRAEWQLEFSGLDTGGPHISRACLWFGSRVVTPTFQVPESSQTGPELRGGASGAGAGALQGGCLQGLTRCEEPAPGL